MFSDLEMPVIGADDGCGGSGGSSSSSGYGSVQNSKQEPHKQASKQAAFYDFLCVSAYQFHPSVLSYPST